STQEGVRQAEAGRGRFRRREAIPVDPLTGAATMFPSEAVERLNVLLAHAWMVRTFLKHADEIQEDEEMLDVPRTLFDSIRAVEPARERGDTKEYLRRLQGKLPKLRRIAEFFARESRRVSPPPH